MSGVGPISGGFGDHFVHQRSDDALVHGVEGDRLPVANNAGAIVVAQVVRPHSNARGNSEDKSEEENILDAPCSLVLKVADTSANARLFHDREKSIRDITWGGVVGKAAQALAEAFGITHPDLKSRDLEVSDEVETKYSMNYRTTTRKPKDAAFIDIKGGTMRFIAGLLGIQTVAESTSEQWQPNPDKPTGDGEYAGRYITVTNVHDIPATDYEAEPTKTIKNFTGQTWSTTEFFAHNNNTQCKYTIEVGAEPSREDLPEDQPKEGEEGFLYNQKLKEMLGQTYDGIERRLRTAEFAAMVAKSAEPQIVPGELDIAPKEFLQSAYLDVAAAAGAIRAYTAAAERAGRAWGGYVGEVATINARFKGVDRVSELAGGRELAETELLMYGHHDKLGDLVPVDEGGVVKKPTTIELIKARWQPTANDPSRAQATFVIDYYEAGLTVFGVDPEDASDGSKRQHLGSVKGTIRVLPADEAGRTKYEIDIQVTEAQEGYAEQLKATAEKSSEIYMRAVESYAQLVDTKN